MSIYRDKEIPYHSVASKCATIYELLRDLSIKTKHRVIIHEKIRGDVSWSHFDSDSSSGKKCGGGLLTHISSCRRFGASIRLGIHSNDYAELKALHTKFSSNF